MVGLINKKGAGEEENIKSMQLMKQKNWGSKYKAGLLGILPQSNQKKKKYYLRQKAIKMFNIKTKYHSAVVIKNEMEYIIKPFFLSSQT